MSKKSPICVDCNCEVYVRSVRQRNRHQVTREIDFECGSRQREFHDAEANIGRVEFVAGGCSSRVG